ncbi:hypothetical protein AX774_g7921 [Zancudomyces culisetae]|uniref:Uncharacterized protein n=1 Tax=Zancudomyces culisetae TaxID=1213189 RepID=A0A1R1PCI8_ZANCU|nr:hypothetical protein AX774_g7921 [Zancudomyces culisetae]|eukprot:OMH78688.1 hypothetical protein AX774_g7921 [Zancudomyces culisetae]
MLVPLHPLYALHHVNCCILCPGGNTRACNHYEPLSSYPSFPTYHHRSKLHISINAETQIFACSRRYLPHCFQHRQPHIPANRSVLVPAGLVPTTSPH